MITVLIEGEGIAGDVVEIGGDAYRHLFRARRVAVGDRLRVVDGEGVARWATVRGVGQDRASVALAGAAPGHEIDRRIELLVAPPRGDRLDWLVEKAVELGVAAVRLVAFERIPRAATRVRPERLRRVAVAALQQCHRARLPTIVGPEPLARSLADSPPGALHLLERDAPPAAGVLTAGDATFVVGPEGGLTDDERRQVLGRGAKRASLGRRTLRIETAAIAAAALAAAEIDRSLCYDPDGPLQPSAGAQTTDSKGTAP